VKPRHSFLVNAQVIPGSAATNNRCHFAHSVMLPSNWRGIASCVSLDQKASACGDSEGRRGCEGKPLMQNDAVMRSTWQSVVWSCPPRLVEE
jgi:hypothetical protein